MTIPLSTNDRESRKFRDKNSTVVVAVVTEETTPTDPSKNNASYTVTRTLATPLYTTVIEKVIGGTTYTKTIVKNTTTNIETISAWS